MDKKYNIAMVLDDMEIGGIPKTCISQLKYLCKYANVTMFLQNDKGPLVKDIPQDVNVIVRNNISVKSLFKKLLKQKKIFTLIKVFFQYVWYGHIVNRWVKTNALTAKYKDVLSNETYDLAMACHGMNIGQLCKTLYQVKAKKKIAWIHGDHPFTGIHKKDVSFIYDKFDKVFCVSKNVKEKFITDFPLVKEKTEIYYNHIDVQDILQKAEEKLDIEYNNSQINVVTVGRVSKEKGQDLIPGITKNLISKGYNVHWYIVGDGPDRQRIENLIVENGVDKNVTILGMKSNPYPYVKNCDIYVQTSYSEAYGLTIFEAVILEKIVIATDVGGANELLKDGENIIFVKPDVNSIAEKVHYILLDKNLQEKIKNNLHGRDYSNESEIKKLLEFLDKE